MLWTSAPKCSCTACSGSDLSGDRQPNGPGGKPQSLRDAQVKYKAKGWGGALEPERAALQSAASQAETRSETLGVASPLF